MNSRSKATFFRSIKWYTLAIAASLMLVCNLAMATVASPKVFNRFLVYFKDKANSPYQAAPANTYLTPKSIARRTRQGISIKERDWPVNPSYVLQVTAAGADVWYTSRWLNAAVIECDAATLSVVNRLSCIDTTTNSPRLLSYVPKSDFAPAQEGAMLLANSIKPQFGIAQVGDGDVRLGSVPTQAKALSPWSLNYGQSNQQNTMLGIDSMHDAGYFGQGITIAVLDGGFNNVNRHDCFSRMRTNGQIKGTFDFVRRGVGNVYQESNHGGAVLSILAGYLPGKLIGPAYGADFYLFRTEEVATEYEIECAYWVLGAERADSLGCDLINTSLGYNTFDNPDQDYTLADLDGRKTFISRAANIAASTGMSVFVSAGNTGGSGAPWYGKITTPSDADSVMAIGAVTLQGNIAGFSGRGPNALGTIKPDLASPGAAVVVYNPNVLDGITASSGTSFASPITCGLAAGLLQAYPNLSVANLHQLMRLSASQANAPDTVYGYGIPNFNQFRRVITGLPIGQEAIMPRLQSNIIEQGQSLKLISYDPNRDANLRVRLYDGTSKLVAFQSYVGYQQTIMLDFATQLASGLYYLRVSNGKVSRALKFVVR